MREGPEELREALSCEIGVRPAGAPALADILPHVSDTRMEQGRLVVKFRQAGRPMLEAFAEAERACCPGIGVGCSGQRRSTPHLG